MPEATNDEQLPQYLSDSPTTRSAAPRTAVPVREDRTATPKVASRQPTAATPPAASSRGQAVGSIPAAAPPAHQGESMAPAPANSVRNRFAARRDVADVLRGEASAPTAAVEAESQIGDVAAQPATAAVTAKPTPAPAAPVAASRPTVTPKIASRPSREVLFSSQQPAIASKIEGPHQIVVGRQAEYRVTLVNTGEAAAHELVAEIAAPAEADLVDATASNGEVQRPTADGTSPGKISWRLYELAPGASQTLTLQLVPRSGRQLQLGVQWRHAPVGGQATVEVQEPKLNMEITGPSDVLFGQSQRYALTLTNPGNGTAESVAIELTPPGGGADSLVRHSVGPLAPGESKKIELELTAREAGELPIKAIATATGNLRAEAVKNVLCRKSELEVDWRGPDKKYAGSVAAYFFRVRNPGTATAEQVSVEVTLPPGTELVQSSDGHTWDAKRRTVSWKAAAINAGEQRFMQLECRMSQPGVNQMEVLAHSAAGDLRDAKTAEIAIEAIADLKLSISDPKGVVPVGEMAEYEIRIQNRGMTAARGVNVVAMFSEGLDPSHVEGGQHSISDGRVAFRTIDTLAAGGETVLKIHAKASQSGTHIFRTEVACEELEVKLAAEETTRFFTEEDRWADASSAYSEEGQTTTR